VGWRCGFLGHEPAGKRRLLEGVCRSIRHCKICHTPVEEICHRQVVDVFLDPARPCFLTTRCDFCHEVLLARESHEWTEWELTDAAKNESTRTCARGHSQTEHRHQWVPDGVSPELEYDAANETFATVSYEHRRCTSWRDRDGMKPSLTGAARYRA